MAVTLRAYGREWLPAMARLFREAVHVACAGEYSPEEREAWAPAGMDAEAWGERFARSLTLLAFVEEGELAGFGNVFAEEGLLDCLYVGPRWQGRGIGAALCDALEPLAGGTVRVHASLTARGFFERRGYRMVRRLRPVRRGLALTCFEMHLGRGAS